MWIRKRAIRRTKIIEKGLNRLLVENGVGTGVFTAAILLGALVVASCGDSESGETSQETTRTTNSSARAAAPTTQPGSQDIGSGGGGDAPPHLLAVLDSLPFPPGVTLDVPPASKGPNHLQVVYLAQTEPQEVLDYYARELPELGWQLEAEPTTVFSEPKLDGTQAGVSYFQFVKDELRTTVAAAPNGNIAIPAPTRMLIDIRLASEPRWTGGSGGG